MSQGKHSFDEAVEVARSIKKELQPLFSRLRVAGSIRRREQEVGDIDMVGDLKPGITPTAVIACLREMGLPVSGYWKKIDFHICGLQVNLYIKPQTHNMGALMKFATGPAGYNIGYRKKAKGRGWTLNQYGLWGVQGDLIADTEREIYSALGKAWKHPTLRGK